MFRKTCMVTVWLSFFTWISGCGGGGGSSSDEIITPTGYLVGPSTRSDPGNVYPGLLTPQGSCIADAAQCEGTDKVTQLKMAEGFTGFPYGLANDAQSSFNLDPDVDERIHTYSGTLSTYTAKHFPVAVEHGNFTYFIYTGPVQLDERQRTATTQGGGRLTTSPEFLRQSDGRSNVVAIYLSRYNHQTGKVAAPVLIHAKNTDDPHDNAVLNFDQQGNLYILISGRDVIRSALLYFIAQPGSQSKLSAETLELANISPQNLDYTSLFGEDFPAPGFAAINYPKLFTVEGGLRLIYTLYCNRQLGDNCGTPVRQIWSAMLTFDPASDSRATLEAPQLLASLGGHYAIANASRDGQDMVLAFNVLMQGQVADRANLYFLYSNDSGETWRYVDRRSGQRRSAQSLLPILEPDQLSQVAVFERHRFSTGVTERTYLKDIVFTGQGDSLQPSILFLTSRGGGSHQPTLENRHTLRLATLQNAQWQVTDLTTAIDHNYSTGFLHRGTDGQAASYFPATPEDSNNGMAGGVPAKIGIASGQPVGNLEYFSAPTTPGEAGYLATLCETNYLRSVHHRQQGSIIGVASAANAYQFVPQRANQNLPAAPILLLTDADDILVLPQQFETLDENLETLPLRLTSGESIQCDYTSTR